MKPASPDTIDQLRTMIETLGMTQRQIASQLGCAQTNVSYLCRKYGIRCQKAGRRPGGATREKNPKWRGGRYLDRDGYILVLCPDHPRSRRGYVLEHRLVMERHIGRHLLPGEVVHHRNDNRTDNRIENLELFGSNGEHLAATRGGICPKWSEEGRQRILAGVRSRGTRRRRTEPDAEPSHQATGHRPASPGSTVPAP